MTERYPAITRSSITRIEITTGVSRFPSHPMSSSSRATMPDDEMYVMPPEEHGRDRPPSEEQRRDEPGREVQREIDDSGGGVSLQAGRELGG